MPRIPKYERRLDTPAQPRQRLAAPREVSRFDIPAVQETGGRRLEQIGQTIAGLGELVQRQEDEREKVKALKTISDATLQWSQEMNKRMNEVEPGAPDFTEQALSAFDKFKDERMGEITNKAAKNFADLEFLNLREKLGREAIEFESRELDRFKSSMWDESIQNMAISTYEDPSLNNLQTNQNTLRAAIDNADLSPQVKAEKLRDGINKITHGAALRMSEVAPETFLKYFDDKVPEWASSLTPKQITVLKNGASRELKQRKREEAQIIKDTYYDQLNRMEEGIIPKEDRLPKELIVKAMGEDAWETYKIMDQYSKDLSRYETLPLKDIDEEMKKLSEEPIETPTQKKAIRSKMGALVARQKNIMERPLATAVHDNPKLQKRYDEFLEAVEERASAGELRSKASSFLTLAKADQSAMGVIKPQVIPEEYKKIVENYFASPLPGIQKLAYFDQLKEVWGDDYDQAVSELRDALPQSAYILGKLRNEGARRILVALDQETIANLKKAVPDSKFIETESINADSYINLQRSFSPVEGGGQEVRVWREAAQKLALKYMEDGTDYGAAIDKAMEKTIDANYYFHEGVRVPQYYANKRLHPNIIGRGIKSVAQALRKRKDFKFADRMGLLKKGFTGTELQEEILANVKLMTSLDDSGVIPYVIDADGIRQFLAGPDRKRIQFTWDQIMSDGIAWVRPTPTLQTEKQKIEEKGAEIYKKIPATILTGEETKEVKERRRLMERYGK